MRPMFSLAASAALAALTAACAARPAPVAEAAAPPPPPKVESLTIEFGSGGASLTRTAQAQLDGAARLYRDARPTVMIVSGHSDKVGPEFPNLLLSARRASVVKRALVDRGVPDDRLQLVAVGEAEPTPSSSAGRVVVVTWR
jgi:outer membrane protein OmpA-like peptidoglycan-associated protein